MYDKVKFDITYSQEVIKYLTIIIIKKDMTSVKVQPNKANNHSSHLFLSFVIVDIISITTILWSVEQKQFQNVPDIK